MTSDGSAQDWDTTGSHQSSCVCCLVPSYSEWMLDIVNVIIDWMLLHKIVALILTIAQQRRVNISILQIIGSNLSQL